MRVLIVGAGGVGGYIGARLVAAGMDVMFVVREARRAQLAAHGLVVESPLGNFSGAVAAVGSPSSGFSPDVAIVACKAHALDRALDVVDAGRGPHTRILPLLNGVAHLDVLRRRFPDVPVLGGLVHGALTLREDGVVAHLTPFFSAIVGTETGAPDAVAEEFVRRLSAAHVDVRLSPDIRQDMWNKFVFLATFAGITCLMRASIGTIMCADGGEDITLQLLDECLAVSRAEGFAPDEASMSSYRRVLTEPGSTFTSSMLRDILSGHRTEADHIVGDMLRRARRHRIDTPMLKIALAHLQCFEATVRHNERTL
ncbi:2-dehydropantoate 2-reductase [Hyphomicrobium nitrativorans NL23]|uniref:2-dehydropantoate 2-reductase n=1 Tax=Hyphomicrobium nitrativorans NL23 TaxID=1029756 RepID=V5SCX4_9HYPH|nr:ketopantoate reductase family protein [Hyphomicrobium nitrativorans]AHB48373.1 2-dehydropantoate 2-reductase [Hyphomicrobium nitrativorans NL23]